MAADTGIGNSKNTTEWCELLDAEIECFTINLGTCFDKKNDQ